MGTNKWMSFLKMGVYEKRLAIVRNTYHIFHKSRFGSLGKGSYIWKPTFLSGMKSFYFGEKVGIFPGARIEAISNWEDKTFHPKIVIGNNVYLGQELFLACAERIEIEDNVVCSARVMITDISHVTEDREVMVLKQGLTTKPVRICEGAFVGVNVSIMPGVTIGRHAVVGANSVVTKDVPDYATVVGSPARVIKRG